MKFEKLPEAEPRDGDSAAMLQAIEALKDRGFDVRRPRGSAYQLKVAADLSYYPDKGTIFRDGAREAMPQRGLEWLVKILARQESHLSDRLVV